MTSFTRTRPITATDEVAQFDCGEQSLNNWLNLRAIRNEADGNSRTFVTIERDSGLIAGYYCLSSHSIDHERTNANLRRNAPNPVPVILIGRLAVDTRFAGQGVGASLLQDALLRGVEAANTIGSRAFLVDALNEDAQKFYARYGFANLPGSGRVMYMLTKDATATIRAASP